MGLRLEEIGDELARLPAGRTPNGADWTRISTGLRARIDARIAALTRTRGLLDQCIGCGCLSLKKCGLYNREAKAAQRGAGPRHVIGDRAGEVRRASCRERGGRFGEIWGVAVSIEKKQKKKNQ